MRNEHSKIWNNSRKLKIVENGKRVLQDWNMARNTKKQRKGKMQTIGPIICLKKTVKTCKMRNEHSRTRNMMRKLKNVENEKLTLDDL